MASAPPDQSNTCPDSEQLAQARILPITAEPQLGACQFEAKPDGRRLHDCLIGNLSSTQIQSYFSNGGDICPRDSQGNNPAHLLAKYHGHTQGSETEALANLQNSARTMMTFYSPVEATLMCTERNTQGNNPWDLLVQPAEDELPAGAKLIAKIFLQAAASPLYAGVVRHQQQCSALTLLPHLGRNEELLGLVINTDPKLVIHYHPQTPRHVSLNFPTLLIAAVTLRQPTALNLLLRGGSQCPAQHNPAVTALNDIAQWYGDPKLQACVNILCDWGVTLAPDPDGTLQLPSALLQVLSHWQYLMSTDPARHREGVLKVFKLLLDLVERHDTPVSFGPLHAECSEGLRHWLQQHVPLLWQQCQAHLSTATEQ